MLGLIDDQGKELSQFQYTFITPSDNGICWALKGTMDSALGMELYILKEDEADVKTPLRLSGIGKKAYNGLISVRDTDGFYKYINLEGEIVLEKNWRFAGDFVNGCAAVVNDDEFGAIDAAGRQIVPCRYDYLEVSEYGYIIAAQSNEKVFIFDQTGKKLDEYYGDNISIGLVGRYYTVCDDINLRVYSDTHELLFEIPADASVYEGLGDQLLISDGAFGEHCVRIRGSEKKYQNIYPLGDIEGQGVYGFISVDVRSAYNNILEENQYSLKMESMRCGVIDSRGEILLDSEYLSVELLGEDRLLVQTEDQWQMIDIRGKVYWSQDIK